MTPTERLTNDMKEALRAKETVRLDAVRFLLAQVKNVEIDKPGKVALTEDEFVKVVKKLVKNAEESIAQFQQGGREDLVADESAKLAIWKQYLPQMLDEAAVLEIVKSVLAENPGKPMGPLIGQVLSRAGGKTDGSVVSRLLKQEMGN